MALITEGYEVPGSGVAYSTGNTIFNAVAVNGGASGVASTSQFFQGAKSARVQCPTAGTDSWHCDLTGLSDTSAALQFAVRFNTLPNLGGTTACKLTRISAGTSVLSQVRYGGSSTSSGNVFQVVDPTGAVLTNGTSAAFSTAAWYLLEMYLAIGTTVSNGTLWVRIWENGSIFFDRQWTTANLGTVALDQTRVGKVDTSGTFDGWCDYFQYLPAATGLIGYPATATASASAGSDQIVDPFNDWQSGDGAAARAQLNANGSAWSGGTPDYTWSGPAGVSFSDPHDPLAQAILPQDVTTQSFTLTLLEQVKDAGGTVLASSTDTAVVTVNGSDAAKLNGSSVWRPCRFVQQ